MTACQDGALSEFNLQHRSLSHIARSYWWNHNQDSWRNKNCSTKRKACDSTFRWEENDNVKQISQCHCEVGWQRPISRASSWGNNALDKRSAQLGRDDSHPSRQLSKSLRRRWCCSPKTWLIDVRCRMQIDLQLSCAPQIRQRKTSAVTRQRQAEIIAFSPATAAAVEAAQQSSQLIAAWKPWNWIRKC